VSDLLAPRPPRYDDEDSRTRAIWGLVALAIIAVIIVVVLLLIGGGGSHHGAQTPTDLSQLPTAAPTSSAQTSGPAPSTPATSRPPTSSTAAPKSTAPVPTSTANPCPTPGACAVPGDAGQLVAAVNAFRNSHGRPAVPGAVSPAAQQCALSQGNGAACAQSFAWEPVPTQDGTKVVELISGRGGDWLLDPSMTSFSIGWAYAPGTGYECAILKVHS
jgi:hypothetical protein